MPAVPLLDLLRAQLGDRLASAPKTFLDLFGEDAVLECPFAPPGGMRQLVGKESIASYLNQIKDSLGSEGMTLSAAYRTTDPDVTILEYDGIAFNQRSGARYPQKYIALIRLRAGRIILFREYWNPLPVLKAFGPPAKSSGDGGNLSGEE